MLRSSLPIQNELNLIFVDFLSHFALFKHFLVVYFNLPLCGLQGLCVFLGALSFCFCSVLFFFSKEKKEHKFGCLER